MTTVVAGQSVALASQWYAYSGGPAVDLTGVTISIETLTGVVVLAPTSSGVGHPATGVYTYTWSTSAGLTPGSYLVIWAGTDDQSDAVSTTEIVTVTSTVGSGTVTTAGAWYCTREDVKAATDSKETARNNPAVDRAAESAVHAVDGLLHRSFLPVLTTRYLDWPGEQRARPWRLWLDSNEVISVSALVAGGTTIAAADYFPRRSDRRDEPPYTHIEIDLDSTAAFSSAGTHQRAIEISGLFGFGSDVSLAGALAEALDASETGVDVTNSAAVGVGDVVLVDSERMIVTAKSQLDTGVNIDAADSLTASMADVAITMSTATGAPAVDEVILIGSERMLVVSVAGLVLTVKRAWDGSVLAVHAGSADIYAPRTLTVTRGALGTVANTHATSTALYRHRVPGLIRQLAVAEAIVYLQQESAGYARTAGSGESEREVSGKGLADLRKQALARYGRRARKRAV